MSFSFSTFYALPTLAAVILCGSRGSVSSQLKNHNTEALLQEHEPAGLTQTSVPILWVIQVPVMICITSAVGTCSSFLELYWVFACLCLTVVLDKAIWLFQSCAKITPGVVDVSMLTLCHWQERASIKFGKPEAGFWCVVYYHGCHSPGFPAPKAEGCSGDAAAQPSCGTSWSGWKSLFFWQCAQVLVQGEKMTPVFCLCGGRTNSVSLLHRTAPSALARRTSHRPQPH